MKKKFQPILGDLSKLTEQQQQEYLLAVCEHLQVPPELGLINLSWMDTGDSARQLVVYVKRGATDIIRDIKKINVTSLAPLNGDGYVGFTATGTDSTGRQEMAVGAVSIKGLSGTAIANAVKTAQTQSLRRMTLQFAGGGFLDESEVNEKTTNIASSSMPLAQIAQPTVQPNVSAGKDITDVAPPSTPTPEPLRPASPEAAVQAEEPKRRRRKKTVTLDSESPSEVLQAELEPLPNSTHALATEQKAVGAPTAPPVIPPSGNIASVWSAPIPLLAPTPAPPPVFTGQICTPEQKAEFRKKLSSYVNDILPKAGFLQSEKLGSRNDKIKLFVQKMFPGADTKNLSFEQWSSFFTYLDGKIQEVGAEALVKLIDKEIGETA